MQGMIETGIPLFITLNFYKEIKKLMFKNKTFHLSFNLLLTIL